MKEVILLCGNAGHGKDSFSNFLHEVIPNSRRDSFAAPIKAVAELMVGIPLELSNAPNELRETIEFYGRTIRKWLQILGTEIGRDIVHKDVWVHRFADRVRRSAETVTIGSDGRFKNEIIELKRALGFEVRVRAVRIVNQRVPVNLDHPSESEIAALPDELFDHVVTNDGSLEDLRAIATSYARLWGLLRR